MHTCCSARVNGDKPRAPGADLRSFACERFEHEGMSHDVYRKGAGPAVLVLTEMPGISPRVLGFADRVVALGCSAVLPDLFGQAGRDPDAGGELARGLYGLRSAVSVCISREFNLFAAGRSAPVVTFLRALAEREHTRCGGPGVGVVGMCFTGGFALAMAVDSRVLAPVLSQPSLPFGKSHGRKHAIDCAPADLERVAGRCAREGLQVLGLRFREDPLVPEQRFQFLREQLGAGFVAVELDQADGHPDERLRKHHSVLTAGLINAPHEATYQALQRVLELLRTKLLDTRG
jgi:dienelactone hydrolase